MSMQITTAEQGVGQLYDSGARSWDPDLTDSQRAMLRSLEQGSRANLSPYGALQPGSSTQQQYPGYGANAPVDHGMGPDGKQMTQEDLLAAILERFQQNQQSQQPEEPVAPAQDMAYWGGHQPQPTGEAGIQRPDYGTVQQRPQFNFSQQAPQTQPMSIRQAQVGNMHNTASSNDRKGLLDMPGLKMPGLLQ